MADPFEYAAYTTSHGPACQATSQCPLIFFLPSEILQYILSYLDFPSLENFRRTSHLGMTYPYPSLLQRAEEAYRIALFEKEKKYARAGEEFRRTQASLSYLYNGHTMDGFNNLHKNPITRADRLHCFTCYSYLERDQFTKAQTTGRRTFGHAEAMKRFCIACGFREKKWSHATCFRGRVLPCFRCQRIAQTDMEAKKLDLCSDCFRARGRELGGSAGGNQRSCNAEMDATVEFNACNLVKDIWHARNPLSEYQLGDENDKLSSAALPSRETWTGLEKRGDRAADSPHTDSSRRAERCVRCWMIDHTFQPALPLCPTSERLCESCWMSNSIIRANGIDAPDLVQEIMMALE
jgi:F-box domain